MSGSLLSRDARSALERLGSEAGEAMLSARGPRPTRSMVRGTVAAVNETYTYDVALPDGSTMEDVPYTLGAARANVGDTCLVEVLSGRAWVTGVVANADNGGYVKWANVRSTIKQSVSVTAPDLEGYEFVMWVEIATDGWVGSVYPQYSEAKSTVMWNASYPSGTGGILCYALYQRVS